MTSFSLSSRAISTRRGGNGAWQRFERGEMELWDFYVAFGQELSDTVLGNVWYSQYCAEKGIGERPLLAFRRQFPRVHFRPSWSENDLSADGFFSSFRPATSQIVQNCQRSWELTAER